MKRTRLIEILDRHYPAHLANVIGEWIEGRDVQVEVDGKWMDLPNPKWDSSPGNYRVKPKTVDVERPFTAEDWQKLGHGLHIRRMRGEPHKAHAVCSYDEEGVVILTRHGPLVIRYNSLAEQEWEFSSDLIHWFPCVHFETVEK